MASQTGHLNFVLIPLMSPGHLIPMIDMAKLLAQRGVSVSVIVTPLNATRASGVIDRAIASGLPIRILQVRFPSEEAGLPEGCESFDALPARTHEMMRAFFVALNLLQQHVEKVLEEISPRPSCIVCTKHLAWMADTARRFQIPRIIFNGMSCFVQICTHRLHTLEDRQGIPDSGAFVIPDLPDRIEVTKDQLPGAFNPGSMNLQGYRERIRETEEEAYGVVVNSFEELEGRYCDEFRKMKGGKVWCIGPLALTNKDNLDKAQRGNKSSINEDQCLKWLDSRQPGSVVYACLGSLSRMSPSQFAELALGLEESNRPFILVAKAGTGSVGDTERWLLENGYEERTKDRGLLIRGWAPQVLILSHPSVGAFLTHCGWNSSIEGVGAGVAMVTWPLFAEQFLNEKLIVKVLGIGVSVGAEEVVYLWEEEGCGVKVRSCDVTKAIERVMDDGEEGNERRSKARRLGELAKEALGDGGSSHLTMTRLIEDIMNLSNRSNERS